MKNNEYYKFLFSTGFRQKPHETFSLPLKDEEFLTKFWVLGMNRYIKVVINFVLVVLYYVS